MQTHQPYHLSAKCQTAEPISPRISWLRRAVKRKLCPKLTDCAACVRSVDFSPLDLADLHRASFLHGLGDGRRDEDWRQAVLPGDLRLRAVDDRLGKGPLLGGKGHGVAIPHDLVAGAGGRAVCPIIGGVVGRVIFIHDRALGAKDLHPLIVSIHCLATVVNDAHSAVGEFTTAVSTSPASPMAGSTSTAP